MTWQLAPEVLADVAIWGGLALMVFGLLKMISLPMAAFVEAQAAWRRRHSPRARHRRHSRYEDRPRVSVIVPAYNEGPVLVNCVNSLVGSDYDRLEIVIVDDGSTDDTAAVATRLAQEHTQVLLITQANAGKGAALNRGIAAAGGDVLFFVDADGIFAPGTIGEMLRGFDHPDVGAVCGDDRPVNLNRVQTRMLAILNHAGTGLVRRALALAGVLPIVSGNVGAFTRDVVEEVGGFDESTIGEDLELTWRVHRAGYRVRFQPAALVYAESPSTWRTLWRQRVRWARGLLQTMRLHRDMIGNPRFGLFGLYLGVNTLSMVVMPMVQLVVLACLPFAFAVGEPAFTGSAASVIGWLGLAMSVLVVVYAVLLNRSPRDLRHLWTLALWPIYSTVMAAVVVSALWLELRGGPAKWHKMQRTGVVSVPVGHAARA
ncbi:glycosyltransferase [Occultella gossypii]|uniref:Glycosyltransferase family 2 protein n=1 Tax=Occultella gossypii TaxID=2800820 RepID=A0ABS7SES5_9MICO|nr:glycosyltransferase family 2 protein [Occultella gossypii]MBZ2198844.1 glycosyltransferase family 2 protein [Occultella gossypii]